MATVQIFYFTKNNQVNFDCTATPSDAIRCEAVVTFSGAEIGQRYFVYFWIRQPNGQDFAPYSEYAIAQATTTFYLLNPLNFSILGTGTFTLLRVEVVQG